MLRRDLRTLRRELRELMALKKVGRGCGGCGHSRLRLLKRVYRSKRREYSDWVAAWKAQEAAGKAEQPQVTPSPQPQAGTA